MTKVTRVIKPALPLATGFVSLLLYLFIYDIFKLLLKYLIQVPPLPILVISIQIQRLDILRNKC